MPLPPVTLAVWRGVVTPLQVLAIGCTIFRLWRRRRKLRLWWDDYWAAVALVCDMVYAVTPFLKTRPAASKNMGIMVFWMMTVTLPLVCWSARISIGMSIARIVPPQTRARYLLYGLNGIFGLMCIGQELYKIIVCTMDISWHNNRNVTCYLGGTTGIISITMDLIADACLVAIPLRMLWRVRLPRTQRRLILWLFASSSVSSAVSIIYFAFVLRKQTERSDTGWGMRIALISGIKAAVNVLVCNVLVIVTYLYCLFWKVEDEDVSEPSETRDKQTHPIPPTSGIQLTEISHPGGARSASIIYVRTAPCYPSPLTGHLDNRISH